VIHLALLTVALTAADTVSLPVAEAYRTAMEAAPEISAARSRALAAEARADQSGALPNPDLSVSAENLGREREVTGIAAPEGIEGQAVLTFSLPWGPTRSGSLHIARAEERVASSLSTAAEHGTAQEILLSLGELVRRQAVEENARLELETLNRLAEALELQAREGRAAASDAARAQLSRGLAATGLARKTSARWEAMAEVARRLGRSPADPVALEVPRCASAVPLRAGIPEEMDGSLPEALEAAARVDAAEASVTLARGLAIPDLQPQLGLRRAVGTNALYVGIATTLPLFDRGRRRVEAARNAARAAQADLASVESRLEARRVAAERRLTALEEAGTVFTGGWFASLDRSVTAAETRYALGEGTLFELLDHRRARLEALDDYAAWQAEWWAARADLTRLRGRRPDASLLCSDPFRENR
jgi:cobalt-zinc-cadmium efflux system outer membrane protein